MNDAAEPAGPDVLAELLAVASEAGPERLVEADRLLRELAGDEAVNWAHRIWTSRLRAGLLAGREAPESKPALPLPADGVFNLTRRVRATAPASAPSKCSGRRDTRSEPGRDLVRRRPDPRDRGRDSRDGRDSPRGAPRA